MSSEDRKSLNKLLVSKTEPAHRVESQDINISASGVLQFNLLNDGEEACAEGDNVKGPTQATPQLVETDKKSNLSNPYKPNLTQNKVLTPIPDIPSVIDANDASPASPGNKNSLGSENVTSGVENYSTAASWESIYDRVLEFALLAEGVDEGCNANMASTVLLSVVKLTRNKWQQPAQGGVIGRLQETLYDLYGFVNHDLSRHTSSHPHKDVLVRISQEMVDCAYFIRHTFNFGNKNISAKIDPIAELQLNWYLKTFKDLKQALMMKSNVWRPPKTRLSYTLFGKTASTDTRPCLSRTRAHTLEWLSEWVNKYDLGDPNKPNVLFVIGGRGVGKSTIAYSIAKKFEGVNRLGAYYPTAHNKGAEHIKSRCEAIKKKFIGHVARVQGKAWGEGFVNPYYMFGPVLVVIDALEESSAGRKRKEILSFLTKDSGDLPPNLRLLVMSRPDKEIMDAIRENANSVDVLNLHDHNDEAEKDIIQYIQSSLKTYEEEEEPGCLNEIYKELTTMADGLFQQAVAACDFIHNDVNKGLPLKETLQKLKSLPALLKPKYLGILCGHTDIITSVAVSSDGKYIVSGSSDRTIQFYSAERAYMVKNPLDGQIEIITSATSSDWKYNLSEDEVQLWDMGTVQHAQKTVDENMVMVTSVGYIVHRPLKGHTGRVTSVAFSPHGKHIVSGSHDAVAQLWDVDTKCVIGPLKGHREAVASVSFSHDGKNIVSGSWDGTIQIWNANTSQVICKITASQTCITSVVFSPDGKYIGSGSWDGTVKIWSVKIAEPMCLPLEGHTNWITAVVFSPTGDYIVSSSHDRTIRIWNIKTGQTVNILEHKDIITSVAFSPNGKYIASGSHDKTIQIWNVETGEIVDKLVGHTDAVTSVAFFPDGKHIVSGSRDTTVQIWNTERSQVMSRLLEEHANQSRSVAVSSDQKVINPVNSSLDLSNYSTHVLLGAKDAMKHINSIYEDIKNCFSPDTISEYFLAMAGFNEQLIQAHIGYLQEIHIFISGYIVDKEQASLISRVTKYCSPFPFVIFTPSGSLSQQIHEQEWSSQIIGMGENILGVSSLVIYEQEPGEYSEGNRGERLQSLQANDHTSNDNIKLGAGQQGTEANPNNEPTKSSGALGDKSHGSLEGDQVASQEDPISGEHPSDTDTEKHEVHFSVKSFICQGQSGQNITPQSTTRLRQLQMDGTFTAERKKDKDNNELHALVTFCRVACQSITVYTEEDLQKDLEEPPFSFSQIYLKVAVNTMCEDAHLHKVLPQTTSLEDKEDKVTQGTKAGHQFKGDITISTTGIKGVLGGNMTNESSSTVEKKMYKAGIKEYHENGRVWWGYTVDDPSERHHGKDIIGEALPQVDYFLESNSSEKIDDIQVMLNSYWMMRPTESLNAKSQKKIIKYIPWRFGASEKQTGYSTIVQSVKITVPHTLKRRYRFTDKFDFEAFDWDTPGGNKAKPRKAVNVGDGKLEGSAWYMPTKNCKRILETPL